MENFWIYKLTNGDLKMILAVCFCWTLLLLGVAGQGTDPKEVDALRAIKKSLIDRHRRIVHWGRGDPCTSGWTGIVCYNRTLDDGYLHVQELFFLNRNLSGTLSPELGRLSYLKILDFMWNRLTGTIPKEIGSITTLELLLLSGNQLTGSLPDELGNLPNLDRIQIDQNQISGPIPLSFANLTSAKHLHMNNNSLSGQIPPQLSQIPFLVHLLLDNNNLSGILPPELSESPNLQILQLDNNNYNGAIIPSSYGNMSRILKLSLRNCSLQGPIPDWSNSPSIAYIDLSLNQLTGPIPTGALSENMTTIDLSNNNLDGTIPDSFSRLRFLQKVSLANNSLDGSIPAAIWLNNTLSLTQRLFLDFENNRFTNISGNFLVPPNEVVPPNVTIGLRGNPICLNNNLLQYCGMNGVEFVNYVNITTPNDCSPQECLPPYEYAPPSPARQCFCAAPVYIGYRLKSPGFSDFLAFVDPFKRYMSHGLQVNLSQLDIDSIAWQGGPRLRMYLKVFPAANNESVGLFNRSEISWIREAFGGWKIHESPWFGPYEFLNFTLSGAYEPTPERSGISKGALAGIILGTIAGSVTLTAFVSIIIMKSHIRKHHAYSKRRKSSRISIKIDGVKDFRYREMSLATNDFDSTSVVGQGGYGKVYRGILANGTVAAIKRTLEGSFQGKKEFLTEIELLSRVHHKNLVSLIGYCDEEDEQILVYEFMPNGTLRDHLSGKTRLPLDFATRVRVALGAAKGILYLHTEANPPIFHRDIKASNILLDSKFTAKVADFGLSRLAPVAELDGEIPAYISTVVKGTPGYLDPEYMLTHKLTDKSDVYSLGVVLLELLTGMHPISHGKNLVREVNVAYQSGMVFSVVDDRMGSYPTECVEKFINLALNCCQDETDARPCMSEVVRELESIWRMMPESNTSINDSSVTDPSSVITSQSSSSDLKNQCISQDISGSNLVSGVLPSIKPR